MKNKEELKKANDVRELTDEELAQVVEGGAATEGLEFGVSCGPCPECGKGMIGVHDMTTDMLTDIHCPYCGHTEPDRRSH